MKLLDRPLQRYLLELMRQQYPENLSIRYEDLDFEECDQRTVSFNLAYLNEHGLIKGGSLHHALMVMSHHRDTSSESGPLVQGTITAAGIDFLEDDGGLSAILGTVTVRLHADTIRDLIEAKILDSDDVSKSEKPRLIETLKNMPEEGLKQLTQRVVNYGLDQAPGAWQSVLQMLS